jgi:hypothetical protein
VLNERLAALRKGAGDTGASPLAERGGLIDDATGAPTAGLREDVPPPPAAGADARPTAD